MSSNLIQAGNGEILAGANMPPFGNLHLGGVINYLGKSSMLLADRASVASQSASGNTAAHYEIFSLDAPAITEYGLSVLAGVPASTTVGSTAGSFNKAAVVGTCVNYAVSTFGTSEYGAWGGYFFSQSVGGNTAASLAGCNAIATLVANSDGQTSAVAACVINNGTAAQPNPYALNSKVALSLNSAGSTKNSAYSLALKDTLGPSSAAINCTYGYVCDGASVDTAAFMVSTGTVSAVSLLWGIDPNGKKLTGGANSAAPASGGGPFAAGSATSITISLTGLTTALSTTSAAITVNTTAVTASSRIRGMITSYSGTYGPGSGGNGNPVLVNYMSGITAGSGFTFQIYNQDLTRALAGTITIVFEIEN